ncbi:MAG TPA: adenylate/guanylate cyclase domain-containing protein [Burkholderiales bacterium]|nr:adenylate/guanylate cyclase domain-containing protein [Burkholderiales bacterium]
MAETTRRLAAVAFADVAGWSRLVEQNDVETLRAWKALRSEVIEPGIREHGGRLLEIAGDSVLVEFPSAVAAVSWALEVQRASRDSVEKGDGIELLLRIGINVEDVIVDDDGKLIGDGVNIASRVHQLAAPGEIMVTAAVRDYARNKVRAAFTDLGSRDLKNISRRVHVYRLTEANAGSDARAESRLPASWQRRPSIAILPFQNSGGDPHQDYFGEGITEDIITALSRTRSLFVIARNSTLRYRDSQNDLGQIAQDLGVRYVLQGSVRRVEAYLRISSALVDVPRNRAIWAEKFDGASDALFEFQDRIATSIVGAIEPKVYEAEWQQVLTKPTDSLDAYDCVLRALPLFNAFDTAKLHEAGSFLDRALALDPDYAQAHAYKAWHYVLRIAESRSTDIAPDAASARHHALRAINLDPNDALVLAVAGHVHSLLHRQPETGAQLFDRALELNENSAFAWGMSGLTYCYLGEPEQGLDRFARALRLSPFDPLIHFWLAGNGLAEFLAGRYADALPWLHKARHVNPRFLAAMRHLITCLAHNDQRTEAQAVARELLALEPAFRVSTLASWYPLRPRQNLERYLSGLREAGLPD